MKAISIKDPWATLIARGIKTVELRSWTTWYRGPLLICASARPDRSAVKRCDLERDDLIAPGHAIAVVTLQDIRAAGPDDARRACVPRGVQEGLYAWDLSRPRLIEPTPVRGQLGLYPSPISL